MLFKTLRSIDAETNRFLAWTWTSPRFGFGRRSVVGSVLLDLGDVFILFGFGVVVVFFFNSAVKSPKVTTISPQNSTGREFDPVVATFSNANYNSRSVPLLRDCVLNMYVCPNTEWFQIASVSVIISLSFFSDGSLFLVRLVGKYFPFLVECKPHNGPIHCCNEVCYETRRWYTWKTSKLFFLYLFCPNPSLLRSFAMNLPII